MKFEENRKRCWVLDKLEPRRVVLCWAWRQLLVIPYSAEGCIALSRIIGVLIISVCSFEARPPIRSDNSPAIKHKYSSVLVLQ